MRLNGIYSMIIIGNISEIYNIRCRYRENDYGKIKTENY